MRATTTDREKTSVYASVQDQDAGVLHVILLNKNQEGALKVQVTLEGSHTYTSGAAWGFNAASAQVREIEGVGNIAGSPFTGPCRGC